MRPLFGMTLLLAGGCADTRGWTCDEAGVCSKDGGSVGAQIPSSCTEVEGSVESQEIEVAGEQHTVACRDGWTRAVHLQPGGCQSRMVPWNLWTQGRRSLDGQAACMGVPIGALMGTDDPKQIEVHVQAHLLSSTSTSPIFERIYRALVPAVWAPATSSPTAVQFELKDSEDEESWRDCEGRLGKAMETWDWSLAFCGGPVCDGACARAGECVAGETPPCTAINRDGFAWSFEHFWGVGFEEKPYRDLEIWVRRSTD